MFNRLLQFFGIGRPPTPFVSVSSKGRGKEKARLTLHARRDLDVPTEEAGRDQGAEVAIPADVVWAGRDITIPVANPGDVPKWYRVTVTDLGRSEYVIYSSDFGKITEQDFIRLDPGAQTEFIIQLQPDGGRRHTTSRVFHVYVSAFARESEQSQRSIIRHNRYEWAPDPRPEQMAVEMSPDVIDLRPWSKEARCNVAFTNGCYFPVSVALRLVKQDENEKPLPNEEPIVFEVPGAIAPHQRAEGEFRIPVSRKPFEPFAVQAVAEAQVQGTNDVFDITAEQPLLVRYVPFLKVWKDWVMVGCLAVVLCWLIWDVPMWWTTPILRVKLNFEGAPPGELPPNVTTDDLKIFLKPHTARDLPLGTAEIAVPPAEKKGTRAEYILRGYPKRPLFCFRWNRRMPFRLRFDSKKLEAYDFEPAKKGELDYRQRRLFHWEWVTTLERTISLRPRVAVRVNFALNDITQNDKEIRVVYIINGQEGPPKVARVEGGKAEPLEFDLTKEVPEGQSVTIIFKAQGDPSNQTADRKLIGVERSKKPFNVTLDFQKNPNIGYLSIPSSTPIAVPFYYQVVDATSGETLSEGTSQGEATMARVRMKAAKQAVKVNLYSPDRQLLLKSDTATLEVGQTVPFKDWSVPLSPEGGSSEPSGERPDDLEPINPDAGR
ncbi:MAG: hypothetical protein NZT92_06120 [Abditibacteriales bacterium]|nr:hypothetical protein [Abditibacteriales bacterium]MDW8366230.1 hypothetical protein [Abditibacteriales bacterium]